MQSEDNENPASSIHIATDDRQKILRSEGRAIQRPRKSELADTDSEGSGKSQTAGTFCLYSIIDIVPRAQDSGM